MGNTVSYLSVQIFIILLFSFTKSSKLNRRSTSPCLPRLVPISKNVVTQQPKANSTIPQQSSENDPSTEDSSIVSIKYPSAPPVRQSTNPVEGGESASISTIMPMAPVEGCPFGLEFLLGTEQLYVVQQTEMLDGISSQVSKLTIMTLAVDNTNKYDVLNSWGQRIYKAAETGSQKALQCSPSGPTKPFSLVILDFADREIMNIERPFNCGFCLLSCCNCCGTTGTEIIIRLGDGSLLGKVKQQCNGYQPLLVVKDSAENLVAKIEGPSFADCCCAWPGYCGGDGTFNIKLPNGTNVGQIAKECIGLVIEASTDIDKFSVNFPENMDVTQKALLLGAVFLIDFMFFEKNPRSHSHHHHNHRGGCR